LIRKKNTLNKNKRDKSKTPQWKCIAQTQIFYQLRLMGCRRSSSRSSSNGSTFRGWIDGSEIAMRSGWLQELHWNFRQVRNEAPSNDWADNKQDEDKEQEEVKDRVSDNSSLSKLRLLEGINWWSDLSTVE
jgi:hypothetical protein